MGGGPQLPPASAGQSTSSHSPDHVKEITVFLTGFGPFPNGNGGYFEKNASHLITRLLPTALPAHSASNPSAAHVKLVNPTAADGQYVKTEYAYIRDYVKQMHKDRGSSTDLFLHIGQAFGWYHVTVERRAYKQGFSSTWWDSQSRAEEEYYLYPDNAGKTIRDAGENPWAGVPMGLDTAFDVDEVVRGANATLANQKGASTGLLAELGEGGAVRREPLEVKPHHEPGYYGCGFIYYESLANCYVQGQRPDVLFCHVPGETDEESVERARDAIVAVIGAAVHQLMERKEKEASNAEKKAE